jgi:hypothetical protein
MLESQTESRRLTFLLVLLPGPRILSFSNFSVAAALRSRHISTFVFLRPF